MRKIMMLLMAASFLCTISSCGKNVQEGKTIQESKTVVDDKTDDSQEKWKEDVLEIYSGTHNKTIEKAYELFIARNPNMTIDLYWGDEQQNKDVIECMFKGEAAPDVIIIDDMEIDDIEKEKIFLDVKNRIENNDLIASFEVMEEYSVSGRVCAPFVLTRNVKYVGNNLLSDYSNAEIFASIPLEQRIEMMYLYYGAGLLASDEINTEVLKEMVLFIEKSNENNFSEEYSLDEIMGIKQFLSGDFPVICHQAKGFEDMKYYLSALEEVNGRAYLIEGVIPCCKMSVNKMTPFENECLEFINSVLSEEVQQEDFSEGFPVNKKVMKQWLSSYKSEEKITLEVNGKKMDLKAADKSLIENIGQIVQEKCSLYKRDMNLLNILKEEIPTYIKNEKDMNMLMESIVKKFQDIR